MDEANINMLRQFLLDSLPQLCRNGLPKDTAFRVDAMVGITIGTQISSTLICISESVSNTGLLISGNFGSKNITMNDIKQESSEELYYIEADGDCSLMADSLNINDHSSVNSSHHLPAKNRKKKRRTKSTTNKECDNIESYKEEQSIFNDEYVEDGDIKQEPASSEYYDEASYESIRMGEAEERWDEESWAQNNWYDESTGEPSNVINIGMMHSYYKRINSSKKIQRNPIISQRMAETEAIFKMFDTHPSSLVPKLPKGGTIYKYVWDDESKKDNWRADGYRWRQYGSFKNRRCGTGFVSKIYFKIYDGPNSMSNKFMRTAYTRPDRPNEVMIQYCGDESIGGKYPRGFTRIVKP